MQIPPPTQIAFCEMSLQSNRYKTRLPNPESRILQRTATEKWQMQSPVKGPGLSQLITSKIQDSKARVL